MADTGVIEMVLGEKIASPHSHINDEEWEMRVHLAACYRLAAQYGWDDLVFTHISAAVPGSDHTAFFINPFGMLFDEITASSLVKVGMDGEKVEDSPYPVNPAGFLIHGAVHEARPDVDCVMHLHTDAGVAVSTQECGLLPLTQNAMIPRSSMAYHDYEGFVLTDGEKGRLVENLGSKDYMILRNHGLLTCGNKVGDAFLRMFFIERACRIQIMAQSTGQSLISIPQEISEGVAKIADEAGGKNPGDLAWPALLRRLDRIDPSYRN